MMADIGDISCLVGSSESVLCWHQEAGLAMTLRSAGLAVEIETRC